MRYQVGLPHKGETGAVAIFTAIFFLLLISVVTLGFLRIMLQERSQALDNDLSQSALNSAQAGVEDAKRIVKWYNDNNCTPTSGGDCGQFYAAMNAASCNSIYSNSTVQARVGGINASANGVQVSSDASFNQAYTCLDIQMDTPLVRGTLSEGKSDIIPLRSVGGATFSEVRLSWYSSRDTGGLNASLPVSPIPSLQDKPSWPARRPPMMRAELVMHPSGNFRLSDVVSKTRFYYPINSAPILQDGFSADVGGENTQLNPTLASCSPSTRSSMYYCEMDMRLDVPPALTAFNPSATSYYLRLTPIYKDTDYQLELLNGATVVNFSGVEPIVDVTGRANNVFRRMQVGIRADVGANFPETPHTARSKSLPAVSTRRPAGI